MIEIETEKKNVLFYDNLIPIDEGDRSSGFSLEGEALVRVPNNKIKYDYARVDHASKKMIEAENKFRL